MSESHSAVDYLQNALTEAQPASLITVSDIAWLAGGGLRSATVPPN